MIRREAGTDAESVVPRSDWIFQSKPREEKRQELDDYLKSARKLP
jgi:hypothetical protein